MATIPPGRRIGQRAQTIAENVLEFIHGKGRQVTQYDRIERATAVWLRGNDLALKTLKDLIEARREARAMLPVPGTPHELAVYEGRNREARDILAALEKIHRAPLEFGSEGESDG